MKRFFTTAALALVCGYAFGQQNFKPGYIVSLQGDTIRGEVNNRTETSNTLTCSFRATGKEEITSYAPTQIKAYGFTGGKMYEAKKAVIVKPQLNALGKFEEAPVKDQPGQNFMKVLVKGQASLFSLIDNTGQQHYYLQKDSGAVQEIYHLKAAVTDPKTGAKQMHSLKQYVGILTITFQDCSSIGPRIQKTNFKESELIQLVAAYNTCINPGQAVVTNNRVKQKATFGAMAGVNYSRLSVQANGLSLEKGNYTGKPSVTGGLFLDIPLPVVNENLSLHNSVMYVRRNLHSNFDVKGNYSYYYDNYDVTFNLQYVRLMNLLRYTLPAGKYRPFITAGLSNGYLFKENQSRIHSIYYTDKSPNQFPAETGFVLVRKYEQGFVGGLGVLHDLPSGNKLTLETRYEYTTGFSKSAIISTSTSNFTLLVGLGL